MTGQAKLVGIAEVLDSLIDNNSKFIVFAHHQVVIDGIEDIVRKKRVSYVRITGQTEQTERVAKVEAF